MEITGYKKYNLEPFGNFRFTFNKNRARNPKVLEVRETNFHFEGETNLSDEEYKKVHKLMIKEKSDVLTDGRDYYTTSNQAIVRISHPLISQHKDYLDAGEEK